MNAATINTPSLKELFATADEIMDKPIYQDESQPEVSDDAVDALEVVMYHANVYESEAGAYWASEHPDCELRSTLFPSRGKAMADLIRFYSQGIGESGEVVRTEYIA